MKKRPTEFGFVALIFCSLILITLITYSDKRRNDYALYTDMLIRGRSVEERERAVKWVSRNTDVDAAAVVIPALIFALDDPSPRVRMAAALALAVWTPHSSAAIPKLVESLKDENVLVRISSAESLGYIASRTHSRIDTVVPALEKSLEDSKPTVVLRAAKSLHLVKRGDSAIPALLKILRDELDRAESIRISAIHILAEMGPDAQNAQGTLTSLLHEGSSRIKIEAAKALIFTGSKDNLVMKVIEEGMKSQDDMIRSVATEAYNQSTKR